MNSIDFIWEFQVSQMAQVSLIWSKNKLSRQECESKIYGEKGEVDQVNRDVEGESVHGIHTHTEK